MQQIKTKSRYPLSMSKSILSILSWGIAAYALIVYGFLPLGALVHPDMSISFNAQPYAIYAHAFGASLALILGPLQFSHRFRARFTAAHRWLGRAYLLVGVLIGGLSGLYLAGFAFGGIIAKLGFATLAMLWLYTGIRAYKAIRGGDIASHRAWMLRNYALAFAAVTLRIYLPTMMALRLDFEFAYAIVAWLAWVPNMLWAEGRLRKDER